MRRQAAVAALVVALVAIGVITRREKDPRARLWSAVGELARRPTDLRLTGMRWAPRPVVARSGTQDDEDRIRVRLVASEVWASSPSDDIRAVTALLRGERDAAVRGLQAVTTQRVTSAAAWNDLAVALSADWDGDVLAAASALAACEHAIEADPTLHEARFNRAVLLESLSLRDMAIGAYDDYLRFDAASPWATEARERRRTLELHPPKAAVWREKLPRLQIAAAENDLAFIASTVAQFPEYSRRWCETEFLGEWGAAAATGDEVKAARQLTLARAVATSLARVHDEALLVDAVSAIDSAGAPQRAALARAHAAYREGRRRYGERHVEDGVRLLREAREQFRVARSPMALVADYYLANAAIDRGDRATALAIALEIQVTAGPRYRALRAHQQWLRGLLFGFDGLFEHALRALLGAADAFTALGEDENAAEMRDRAAGVLALLGRTGEAWELRGRTLPAAALSGNAHRLQSALFASAIAAVQERQWDAAHALLGLVAGVDGGNPRMRAEAIVWRTLATDRAGFTRGVQVTLAQARAGTANIPDDGLRADVENELRFVEALLVRDQDPRAAIALLDTHVSEAKRRGRTTRLPAVLVERARLLKRDEALLDLHEAISLIELRGEAVSRPDLRDSFLGSADAYVALADLLDREGDAYGALATLDRKRGAALTEDFASRISAGTAVITYALFDDRVVVYASTAAGTRRFVIATTATALARQIGSYRHAIATDGTATIRELGQALHGLLLAPTDPALAGIQNIVFIVDGVLQDVPFAALLRGDGTALIEHVTVSLAPSLTAAAQLPDARRPLSRLLAVGNPAVDRTRFADLPPLPAAADEARTIASMYEAAVVLLDDDATRTNVSRSMLNAAVVHFATHAVMDVVEPRRSRILLAGDDSLSTADIASENLEGLHTVVLAGCRTAVSGTGYGTVRSIASGFVAAGARSVIATLWEVDDQATRELAIAFHRALTRGLTSRQALREAQLAMMRSGRPSLAATKHWAGLQLYGR